MQLLHSQLLKDVLSYFKFLQFTLCGFLFIGIFASSFDYICNFCIYSLLQEGGKHYPSTRSCTEGSTKSEKHRIAEAFPGSPWHMGNLARAVSVTHGHPASLWGGAPVLPSIHGQLCQRKQDITANAGVHAGVLVSV